MTNLACIGIVYRSILIKHMLKNLSEKLPKVLREKNKLATSIERT